MDILKLLNGIVFRSVGKTARIRAKLKKTDLGILQVALMVSALDGVVLESEYAAFRLLARKGFGYSEAEVEYSLRQAMRPAGYMLLLASSGCSSETLAAEFMAEAKALLPSGFAYMSVKDVRQAVITWIAMAMSDGDYSERERMCIEALRLHFAELKASRIEKENEYWRSLPANVRCLVEEYPGSRLKLVSKDFVGKVAEIVKDFGGSADARRRLSALAENGE